MARCAYCGRDLLVDFDAYMSAQLDHLVPKKEGGGNTDENKVPACSVCNILKGDFDPRPTAAKPGGKKELLHAARVHIAKRRAEKIDEYCGRLKKYGDDAA